MLVGVLAKRQLGDWLVSGGLSAGYGWYDSSRAIVTGDQASFVTGSPEAQHAGLHSRISYQVPFDGWYLKPYVDLHAVYTRTSAYTESGSSSLRLDVDAEDELRFSAAPMLELGGRIDAGDGRGLRPYLSVGAEFYDDRDWGASTRFVGAPDDAGRFRTETELPQQVAKLNVGVDLTATAQIHIKLEYAGELGDDYQSHAGTLRFSYLFQ